MADMAKQKDFFRSVDEYLRQSDLQAADDRRRFERFAYTTSAMVAFCQLHDQPQVSDFESVHCYDISRGGLSFYYATSPPDDHLVIALRQVDGYLALRARVAHFRPIPGHEDNPGRMIGCQFIERVDFKEEQGLADR